MTQAHQNIFMRFFTLQPETHQHMLVDNSHIKSHHFMMWSIQLWKDLNIFVVNLITVQCQSILLAIMKMWDTFWFGFFPSLFLFFFFLFLFLFLFLFIVLQDNIRDVTNPNFQLLSVSFYESAKSQVTTSGNLLRVAIPIISSVVVVVFLGSFMVLGVYLKKVWILLPYHHFKFAFFISSNKWWQSPCFPFLLNLLKISSLQMGEQSIHLKKQRKALRIIFIILWTNPAGASCLNRLRRIELKTKNIKVEGSLQFFAKYFFFSLFLSLFLFLLNNNVLMKEFDWNYWACWTCHCHFNGQQWRHGCFTPTNEIFENAIWWIPSSQSNERTSITCCCRRSNVLSKEAIPFGNHF